MRGTGLGKRTFDAHEHPIMLATQPGMFGPGAFKAMRDEFAMELRRAAQKARDLGLAVPAIDLEAMAGMIETVPMPRDDVRIAWRKWR